MDAKGELENQLNVHFFQELHGKLSETCFEKCIKRPRSQLDSSEKDCLGHCVDSYLQSLEVVSKVFSTKFEAAVSSASHVS